MKKLLLVLFLLTFGIGASHAIQQFVWRSSNTATADTLQQLCPKSNRGVFHGTCVNTGAAGTLTIFNSSGTTTSPIAAINTAAVVPCSFYDVPISSGLTYTNSATANVTILFQCY